MILYNTDLKIFTSSLVSSDPHIVSGYSTKSLGDGNKIGSIMAFFKENDISYKNIVSLGQIHSTNIEFIKSAADTLIKIEDTDGVITNLKDVALTVKTADCLPIIYSDEKNGLIAISHQGWRGSLKKMVVKMVDRLIKNGANLNDIKIAIGPGINQCCYDVDDDKYYQFLEELDFYSEKIFSVFHGKKHLNLLLLNYLLLLDRGIKKENIDFFPFCTFCDKDRFFSFRREKKKDFEEMFSFIIRYN